MADKYWYCIIGPVQDELIPKDGDYHPRMAAREAVEQMTGVDTVNKTVSGWIDADEMDHMTRPDRRRKWK